ncbi:MAG: DMT family transporter [Acidimicrobiia bacterium]|nr:DMT family transporter [Acidimicrobiia bacterium]
MVFVLALAAALTYGAGDFLGGIATKRSDGSLGVVALSSAVGVALLLGLVWVFPADPTAADLAWGAAGGVAGGIGVTLFYRALATGVMSVVAPVTAVTGAVVPVAAGLLLGERPGALALVGVALAIVAVALLAREAPGTNELVGGDRTLAFVLALGAGLGFGGFFVLLDRTGDSAGLWPLVASRSVTLVLAIVVAVATSHSVLPARKATVLAIGTGLLDMSANALFLVANRSGLLALVAVVTSLYPASTIALAQIFLGERLARHQVVGIFLAVGAVILIAAT